MEKPLKIATVCALAAGFLIRGHDLAQAQMGQKEAEGTAAGAIIGGILGGVIGGRAGGAVGGAIAGTVIGGLIGNRIGAALDEQDRIALQKSMLSALKSGKSRRFSGRKSGVRGRVDVVSSSRRNGQLCRQLKVHVVSKEGADLVNEHASTCRRPDGSWNI